MQNILKGSHIKKDLSPPFLMFVVTLVPCDVQFL